MRAFRAWTAIVPVWQCLAAECSGTVGSCTAKQASLMQLKSSNLKKLALDTEGSFSSKLAGFQKFTDEMVATYGGSSAKEPTQDVLDAVATVLDFIDDLHDHLLSAHNDDVGKAQNCSGAGATEHCYEMHMSKEIVQDITNYQTQAAQKEADHTSCREDAQQPCKDLCETNGLCDNYDNFRGATGPGDVPSLPTCVNDGHLNDNYIKALEGSKELELMESCLVDMKIWLDGALDANIIDDGLYENYDLCNRVSTDCEADVKRCDRMQGDFQAARCLYALESNLRCDAFTKCYDLAVKGCETHCNEIKIRADARAADNETGERLVCLLAVLFGERDENDASGSETGFYPRPSATERPTKLDECKQAEINTAMWEIPCPQDAEGNQGPEPPTFPTIDGYECPADGVSSPCSTAFQEEMDWNTEFPVYPSLDCSDIGKRGVHATKLSCSEAGECIQSHIYEHEDMGNKITHHESWDAATDR